MLIGGKNKINENLQKEIRDLQPVRLVDYKDFLKDRFSPSPHKPKIIFINLIDAGTCELQILSKIKVDFKDSRTIALHFAEVPLMIKNTLAKGYDAYIPIFKFSEELRNIVSRLSITK